MADVSLGRVRAYTVSREEAQEAVRLIATILGVAENNPEAPNHLYELCRRFYAARRKRGQVFGDDILFDPVWDMLLILYWAHGHSEPLSVTSVVGGSDVPYTTGLRWLRVMEDRGLITRKPNAEDRRSSTVELTETAITKMDKYLQSVASRYFQL